MDKASDILKRVRRIELRAKHLATENFAGQYQSGFRGQGLDFDDFREYMPGDDPRFIDWKVTARMRSPYVRRFREEREQAVILAVDVSGSMHYASSASPAPPNWTTRRKSRRCSPSARPRAGTNAACSSTADASPATSPPPRA